MLFRCIFSATLSLLIMNCTSRTSSTEFGKRVDSLSIYKQMLSYTKFNRFIIENSLDTIYIIENEHFRAHYKLGFPGKKVFRIAKPSGYPKSGEFDYSKFQISFEQIEIKGNNATGFCFLKGLGVLGKFSLSKVNGKWKVIDYDKIMV